MKIKEWAEFNGISEKDVAMIDEVKKMFGGKIVRIHQKGEYAKMIKEIELNNKSYIDNVFLK